MKVYFFHVNQPDTLEACLKDIDAEPSSRELRYSDKTIFLERLDFRPDGECVADFTQRSPEGPGYSAPMQATTDFNLTPESGFGEHTAAVLIGDYLAVQYNHRGLRAARIVNYVHDKCLEKAASLQVTPVLNQDALSRFRRSRRHTKLVFAVYRRPRLEDDHADGLPLLAALESAEATGAGRVEMALSLGPSDRRGALNIERLVERLFRRREEFAKLHVSYENEDGYVEEMNLLGQFDSMEFPNRTLDLSSGGRYTFESRARTIAGGLREWLQQPIARPTSPGT